MTFTAAKFRTKATAPLAQNKWVPDSIIIVILPHRSSLNTLVPLHCSSQSQQLHSEGLTFTKQGDQGGSRTQPGGGCDDRLFTSPSSMDIHNSSL